MEDLIRLAMANGPAEELLTLTTCRCDPAWTKRQLHAPGCREEYRADVEALIAQRDALKEQLDLEHENMRLTSVSCHRAVATIEAERDALADQLAQAERAVIDAELLGIGRVLNALDSDVTEMILIEHLRLDIGNCRCGWGVNTGQLGRSHSKHVLDAIRSAVREVVYGPDEEGQN